MRCSAKIKSSRIGEITLSFTDIGKSRPCREFSTSQMYAFYTIRGNSLIYSKRVTKGTSVPFEMCMLNLFVWTVLFIGTKSRINNIHIRKHVFKLSYKQYFCKYSY